MSESNEVKMVLVLEKVSSLGRDLTLPYFVSEEDLATNDKYIQVKLQPYYASMRSEYRHPHFLSGYQHEVVLMNHDTAPIFVEESMFKKMVIVALSLQGVPEEAIKLNPAKEVDGCFVISILIVVPDGREKVDFAKLIEDNFELASEYSYWLSMKNQLVELDTFDKHPIWHLSSAEIIHTVACKIKDLLWVNNIQPSHCAETETS